MKRNILSLVAAGLLLCSFSSCNNTIEDDTVATAAINESIPEVNIDNEVEVVASTTEVSAEGAIDNNGVVKKINTETFITEVFDYKANPKTWVYKGTKPAIIDFYADWCGPCKKVSPIMDELAKKYKGEVNFYKINTDDEKELSGGVFGIRSIPSILFIPVDGQPSMQAGLMTKEQYIQIINTTLLKK